MSSSSTSKLYLTTFSPSLSFLILNVVRGDLSAPLLSTCVVVHFQIMISSAARRLDNDLWSAWYL